MPRVIERKVAPKKVVFLGGILFYILDIGY